MMSETEGEHHRRLVVIEDDDIDFSFIRKFCREIDSAVELVHFEDIETAGAFLSGAQAAAAMPGTLAVLTDIRLPDGNGLELIESLKGENRLEHIPVFVWSSSDNPSERARAEELGAIAFYRKFETAEEGRKLVHDLCSRLDWQR